jgi:DNA-binding MarR family transcriptional regulator
VKRKNDPESAHVRREHPAWSTCQPASVWNTRLYGAEFCNKICVFQQYAWVRKALFACRWAIIALAQYLLYYRRTIRPNPLESPDSRFGVELLRLTRRCRGIDKYVSSSAGLTIDEMHCLSALLFEQPPSVKRLSELINVNPTRASKLLKELELRGFVSRTLQTADRRREQVALTESGTKAARAILSLFAEVGNELLGSWRRELATDFSWLAHTVTKGEEVHEGA